MGPTCILIRHGEAVHNLTPLGERQCRELSEFLRTFPALESPIELIVVSPMQRTLQTAQQSLGWLMERGVPALVLAQWQENGPHKCDTGSPIEQLKATWKQFDWTEIDPVFPAKEGLYEYSLEALEKRSTAARQWLKNRPEKTIAVVSHAGFLRTVSNRDFGNADFRIFVFEEAGDSPRLKESEVTARTNGGMGRSKDGHFDWGVKEKYM